MRRKFLIICFAVFGVLSINSCNYSEVMQGINLSTSIMRHTGIIGGSKRAPVPQSLSSCMNNLARSGAAFDVMARDNLGRCSVHNQVVLRRSQFPYSGSGLIKGSCHQINALIRWEREVVAPAAMRHLGVPVARVLEMGTYSCRNVAGSNRPSEHSKANAIDIGGFMLRDGRRISVLNDWGRNTPAGRFLKDVHKGSCRVFNGVLGPNYNAAHRDHFHLDMGPYKFCR